MEPRPATRTAPAAPEPEPARRWLALLFIAWPS